MLNQERRNKFAIAFLLATIGFLLRFCFISPYLEGWDSVDFALGLKDYDLSKYQPHFPGYPVYMLFAKLLFSIFKNDVFSLTLTSAIFGSLTIIPFFYLSSWMYDRRTALLASVLLMINPMHWLMSATALSDVMGLFFMVFAVFLLYKAVMIQNHKKELRLLTWASLVMGIGFGVRIAYFPHITMLGLAIFMCARKANRECGKAKVVVLPFLALMGSLLALFLGQCLVLGFTNLINEGMFFLKGHFMEWGGAIFTHPNLGVRLKELFNKDILIHGLGGGSGFPRFLFAIFTAFSFLFFLRKEPFKFNQIFLITWCFPYLLWVFFAQNLNNPRHILAALPVLLLVLSRGAIHIADFLSKGRGHAPLIWKKINAVFLEKIHKNLTIPSSNLHEPIWYLKPIKKINFGSLFILALLVNLFCISFDLVYVHAQEKPAMLKLVNYVQKKYDPTKTIVFCKETKRLFDYYAPEFITVQEDREEIEASVAYYFYGKPKVILITSNMIDQFGLKVEKIKGRINMIKHFYHNPLVQNGYHSVYLYQLEL